MGSKWREPTSTPDWTDIRSILNQLQQIHACSISVLIEPDGKSAGTTLRVSLSAMWPMLGQPGNLTGTGTAGIWPNWHNATLEGLVFALLFQLDHQLGIMKPGSHN